MERTDELYHYGTPRHSGRYPWGSGEDPYQHSGDFLSRYEELRKQGMSETEIAKAFYPSKDGEDINFSTTQLRARLSLANSERRSLLVQQAKSLKSDGLNNVEIAQKMGLKGESTVRSLLNDDAEARMNIAQKTANSLKDLVDTKGMIDIGVGQERELGVSKEKLNQALEILKLEGYEVYGGRVPQATNAGNFTTIKVLCPPGTEAKEIYNYDKINSIKDYVSRDGGDTFEPSFVYPASLDSKRLEVTYRENGGLDKDGTIEIRRGVKDLSLGESNYAQVRIMVDGTHYIKGMAVYSDDLPDGIDIRFNSNKPIEGGKLGALKKIKNDPDNPFGSNIKEQGGQSYYIDENGERKLSLINKRADEGDWGAWSDHLPSQFLSKQNIPLIRKQLGLTASEKEDEYDEIMSLNNPTVKRELLATFADDCDSAAVHLQAAALPGQKYQVILPLKSVSDTEVYAPNYKDGTQVALIRYPHGGTFEIPILNVNNRLEEGKKVLGTNPSDAIGINAHVAERLSGADFDGDTVMVIPLNEKIQIRSEPRLKQLVGFDTKLDYGPDPKESYTDSNGVEHYIRNGKEYKLMHNTQTEMGKISNLITDMTLQGANNDDIAKAVKHSMVVIDAEKHHLDYKQSEIDNDIKRLKEDYQGHLNPETGKFATGASTLISRAKSPVLIPERKEGAFFSRATGNPVTLIDPDNDIYVDNKTGEAYSKRQVKTLYTDPKTGEKLYHDTNRDYYKVLYNNEKVPAIQKDGKIYYKADDGKYKEVTKEKIFKNIATQSSTKMQETNDAFTLSSGTVKEEIYANYANKMKSLANKARLEILKIKDIPYSASAKETYKDEVESLNFKLNEALLNAPRERQAQLIAASKIKAMVQDNPSMTNEEKKKLSQKALTKARLQVGAKRKEVKFTPKEWEAVQAGAISSTKLKYIIKNADTKTLRELATPRTKTTVSSTKINRMKNMAASGYTTSEIAESLGLSSSTVIKYIK